MPYVKRALRLLIDHWRLAAGGIGALAAAALAGTLLFAWSGVYNVAASSGHWYIVDRFLRFGMKNSVERHAPDVTPPELGDPDLVRLGAAHYYAGCAYCHGAPGFPITPIAQHMLPAPPDLSAHVSEWTDQELFWLVKHGLKYTGMPGWPVQNRDDEVWAVVAFLRKMPLTSEAEYRELALAEVEAEPQGGEEIATGSAPDAVSACARCHGDAQRPPASDLVPRLHGQTNEMLAKSLREYADGKRSSGIMQTAASGLSDEQIGELADYYSTITLRRPDGVARPSARGRQLAERGDAAREIPACISCHSGNALPVYPRLNGQNARYMANRLTLWRDGQTDRTDSAAIMAPIARLLTDEDIAAVTEYFSSRIESGDSAR